MVGVNFPRDIDVSGIAGASTRNDADLVESVPNSG